MRVTRLLPFVSALLALGVNAVWAQAPPASIDREVIRAAAAGEPLQVIVTHRPGSESRLRAYLRNDVIRGEFPNAMAVDLTSRTPRDLARHPDVLNVSANATVSGQQISPSGGTAPSTEDIQNLRATLGLTATQTGAGVGIAIIDSGVVPSADLDASITAFYDFTNGRRLLTARTDQYGHGTHVAGLIVGSGARSGGKYIGVAPGAKLTIIKVLDEQGHGNTSDVIRALEFVRLNRVQLGVDIINISLGHPVFEPAATDPLVQAVDRASGAGLVVVTSAGNFGSNPTTGASGYAGLASPGNARSALTVGAVNTFNTASRADDELAPYSSRGPTWYDAYAKPDVVAPGHGLIAISDPSTTLYRNPALRASAAPYLTLSGTSMAAAVATGVVALMVQANRLDPGSPALTPNTVKALLQYTAIPLPDDGAGTALEQGAGAINAAGAAALAYAINPAALPGQPWVDHAFTPYTEHAGTTHTWAQNIVWGDHVVWGDAVLWNRDAWAVNIVWGDHVVWGDSVVRGDSIVWGDHALWIDNIVWGDRVVWGDNIVWGDNVLRGDVAAMSAAW